MVRKYGELCKVSGEIMCDELVKAVVGISKVHFLEYTRYIAYVLPLVSALVTLLRQECKKQFRRIVQTALR